MTASRGTLGAVPLLVIALLGTACASAPQPARKTQESEEAMPEPVQPTATPAPADPPAEPAPDPDLAEADATIPEVSGAYGPKTVVIDDPAATQETTPTLAETAKLARERRASEGAPVAVITDETLPEYATGKISIASEEAMPPESSGAAVETAAVAEGESEEYWRTRVLDARRRWSDLVEEIVELEGEVGELRQRFYAEDDGFYRDAQIKPAWDRALDRLSETRYEIAHVREDLEEILQEGRLAGALPGWLREGIELEPEPSEPEADPEIHEASEPRIVEEDGTPRR